MVYDCDRKIWIETSILIKTVIIEIMYLTTEKAEGKKKMLPLTIRKFRANQTAEAVIKVAMGCRLG